SRPDSGCGACSRCTHAPPSRPASRIRLSSSRWVVYTTIGPRCQSLHQAWRAAASGLTTSLRGTREGGTRNQRYLECDERWVNPHTAGGNLLRGGGYRRAERCPLQPCPVSVRVERDIRGERADLLEIPGCIPAALLGRPVGHPVRAFHQGRL